jgi:DNA-binding CsgD family transcriptional regulator
MKLERITKSKLKLYKETTKHLSAIERYQAGMGKYEANLLEEVTRLARFGCTNVEIAEFYGLTILTLEKYLRDMPELYAALEEGRIVDSMKVVDSLHKQALGYRVKEYEVSEHLTRDGQIVNLKKKIVKHIQPNVTAAIYLLKTRHGDKWMDIIKSEKTQNLNIMVKNVDFSDISDEELGTLKKLGIKRLPQNFIKAKPVNQQNLIQDVSGN